MSANHTLWTLRNSLLGLTAIAALTGLARADVLDDVKSHDAVKCGVTLAAPGFSAEDNAGKRQGFDVDLCKAIAAATLGDEAKIQLVPMDLKNRVRRASHRGRPMCSRIASHGRKAAT